MGSEPVIGQCTKVEQFQRDHRIGLVTLLFTDLVGSTLLKQRCGDQKAGALIQKHHEIVRGLLLQFSQATEIETAGDSFFLVFGRPSDAVRYSLGLQARLRGMASEGGELLRDRVGIHVGEVFIQDRSENLKLFGMQVDTCARVMSLGQGDQILLTRFAFDAARSILRGTDLAGIGPLGWMSHGPYLLKGVEEPTEICEVGEIGSAVLKAPANSEKGHRHISADSEPVLGWRPAIEQRVPGTQWTLERKLGEGGFGEVWLGRHEALKERRVFKFCFRADRVRSLKREVTLFRLLKERVGQHPNIVGIQEVFFDEPPFYIVMDYAEGQDLRSWCEAQGGIARISLTTRLEIVAQVADALQAAHEAGVIHRDVKPSNILVNGKLGGVGEQEDQQAAAVFGRVGAPSATSSSLKVKLTDFGIGQVLSLEALAGMTRMGFTQTMLSPGSTQTGTHLYMAPELLAGQPASGRSDIYSLGVVLYQLLVGDFGRPLTMDWAKTIADPLLRQDLERCFAGNPQERFATAREFSANLRLLARRRAARALAKVSKFAAAAVVLGGMVWFLSIYPLNKSASSRNSATKTIAVIPFTNASLSAIDAYLSDSLSTELIKRLRRPERLNAFRPPATVLTNPIPIIRNNYAHVVDFTLEGTLQKTNDTVKLSVQLVNTIVGKPRWTKQYERPISDFIAIQSDIVQQVAKALEIKVSKVERQEIEKRPTANLNAYLLWLKAEHHFNEGTYTNLDQAIDLYQAATSLDPRFAAAYAGLAAAYRLKHAVYRPWEGWDAKARVAIKKAIDLDKHLPAALMVRGNLAFTPSEGWNAEQAIWDQRQALLLNPKLDRAHENIAFAAVHFGHLERALTECEHELDINRGNNQAWSTVAQARLWKGEYEEALQVLEEMGPNYWKDSRYLLWMKAMCHFYLKQMSQVSALLDPHLAAHPEDALIASVQAIVHAAAGEREKAEQHILRARREQDGFLHSHHIAHHIASAYSLLQQNDEALRWLQKAAHDGFPCYPYFRNDPNLQNLRSDPKAAKFFEQQKQDWERREADWFK